MSCPKAVKEALSSVEGVKEVEVDFSKNLATITMKADAQLKPSSIIKAVPKKYTIGALEVKGLTGTISTDGEKWKFKSAAAQEFEMRPGKDVKIEMENLELKNDKGEDNNFALSGIAKEETYKDEDGEEKIRYIFEYTAIQKVEEKEEKEEEKED